MRLLFFLIGLILSSYFGFGGHPTRVDSLIHLLASQKEDSVKVQALVEISEEYKLFNTTKALEFGEKALILAEKIKWQKGIAKALGIIAFAYENKGDFNLTLEYRLSELKKWEELNSPKAICTSLGNVGVTYSDLGNNKKALEYYFLSLQKAEQINAYLMIVNDLCNIGSVYCSQKEFHKALEFYSRSLKLAQEKDFKNAIANCKVNIGNIQSIEGNNSGAIASFLEGLNIYEKMGDKINIAACLINIAATYQVQADSSWINHNTEMSKKLSEKSLLCFRKALKIADEMDDAFLQGNILGNMGSIYLTLKNYKESEKNIQKALELSLKTNAVEEIIDNYKRLNELYKQTNELEKSLLYYEKYSHLKDSVFNSENTKAITEMEVKYETQKKVAENELLTQQNKIQSLSITNKRYLIYALIIFLILFITVGFFIIRQSRLKAKETATKLQQQLLRSQMNPHFIFNSLQNIESFIYQHEPKEAGVYLAKFSKLMRLILDNSANEYISLEKEIETLEYYLSLQKVRLFDNLDYKIEMSENISASIIMLPPMLTQPFIENAIEHGFRGIKEKGEIRISFILKENELRITVTDNGVGITEAVQQKQNYKDHQSMAMKITEERLKFLNRSKDGKMVFSINDVKDDNGKIKGTKIEFTIPINE